MYKIILVGILALSASTLFGQRIDPDWQIEKAPVGQTYILLSNPVTGKYDHALTSSLAGSISPVAVTSSATQPLTANIGDTWVDTDTGLVNIYDGANWIPQGQSYLHIPFYKDDTEAAAGGLLAGMFYRWARGNRYGQEEGGITTL